MMKQLLLLAVAGALVTSCSSTYMADVAPETADCEIGAVPVGGFNASSVVTYCKNPYTGCIETHGVQVHRDSGINNTAKLAASAAYIAGGTGDVLSGLGTLKYGQSWKNFSRNGFHFNHEGLPGTNINVEGSSAHADGSANAAANSRSKSSAGASADVHNINKNYNKNDVGIGISNEVKLKKPRRPQRW
ncbi:MAG: hypothetical protein HKN23_07030 [Verrucomicrobiales bacterium]|nr:hypothetical protein [Verrucomicrobiales bacterium]